MVACSFRRPKTQHLGRGGVVPPHHPQWAACSPRKTWRHRWMANEKIYPSPEQDAYTIYIIIYQIYNCMVLKIVLVCAYIYVIYVHMNYMLWRRLSILSGWKAFCRPSQNPQTPAWLYHFEIVTGCLILNIEFKFSCTSHLPNSSAVSEIAMVESCGPHVVNWITSPG